MNLLPSNYELVKASELELHPDNARRGNLDRLTESIRVNGFYGAIVAQKSTRHIIVGNHRYQAAVSLGIKELPVLWVDIDDAEARRMLLVDNRSNDLASYDDELLVELLRLTEHETGLEGSGFDKDTFDLLGRIVDAQAQGLTDAEAEWNAMPDFKQDDTESAFKAIVHFATEADADLFFETIKRPKKRSMWYPQENPNKTTSRQEQYVADDQ